MTDLKCFECGRTIPPDPTKRPNCGHKYGYPHPNTKYSSHQCAKPGFGLYPRNLLSLCNLFYAAP